MEKRRTRSKTTGIPEGSADREPAGDAIAKDTTMTHNTPTPDEDDPIWEQMGSTQVTGSQGDSSATGSGINSPKNFTEMAPNRVLGKDVMELGDFKLLKKLGEGAMGAVYKAHQISFDRIVALKILFPHVANNPKLVQRLYREGRVMFDLDHPNIVQSFAVGEAEGFHYVAMEYISGRSTQKWLDQLGRLPVGDAVRITIECAKALAYAHSRNMVHRDVKPDNILLTKKGAVKVADLGMVKMDDEEMSLTQTGHAVGTPWYMPLEQARNAKEIDGRSDIYALGCTLYAFLTGQPPFAGRTIVEVIQAKEVGTFPSARGANSDVPERLDLIIAKMTAKLVKNRYQTFEEAIKDLENLGLASETLGFVSQKPVERAPAAEDFDSLGKTNVSAPAKSNADVDFAASAAPVLDPNTWYIQVKMSDGTVVARKYTTAQIQKMLAEGTIKPNARASHLPDEGFRTLGTYKQFQGAALGDMAKKAADKNTARYRGIYKKIEDDEERRAQEEKERAQKEDETTMQATRRYWLEIFLKVLPIGIGVLVIIIFIAWLAASIL